MCVTEGMLLCEGVACGVAARLGLGLPTTLVIVKLMLGRCGVVVYHLMRVCRIRHYV